VLNALVKALEDLKLCTADVVVVSGIGCSSRLPGYLNSYGFNSIHGRAIPIATGLKLARPNITVVVAGGDGDGFAIGGNHMMHAARRNIDITYLLMDNGIYGLTKGQVSPTTPLGSKTKTTYYGAYEKPISPLEVLLAYGCSYVSQGFAADIKGLTALFLDAIQYPGFSYINIISPCVTYRGKEQYKMLREITHPVPEGHDVHDWHAAHALVCQKDLHYTGVLYKERRESYLETQEELRDVAKNGIPSLESLVEKYR
jgi:2-oxoglutarate ferredoxin oxidoreductase subunit beta